MKEEQDIWIFVSHSNDDYDKVRKVRDKLEDAKRRPLLFFLKCLEEDKEVWELIKREIDARARFVLCKSKNTEDPDGWVQKEFEYIKQQNKPYEIIDLDDEDNLDKRINTLVRRSKVLIMNSESDSKFADVLSNALRSTPYQLASWGNIFDEMGPWSVQERFNNKIAECAKEGYLIFVIPNNGLGVFQKEELRSAISISDKNIILVNIHDSIYAKEWIDDNIQLQILDVSLDPQDVQIEKIIECLRQLDLSKNKH